MYILNWNTLVREYEQKYKPDSNILKIYPDENSRVEFIVKIIKECLKDHDQNNIIVCLQEVSDKLLEKIQSGFSSLNILYYKIKENENLVLLSSYESELILGESNDAVRGVLVAKIKDFYIINTHIVPQRYANVDTMAYISSLRKYGDKIYVCGDFNEAYTKVREKLFRYYTCPRYGKTYRKRSIDNIIFTENIDYEISKMIIENNPSDHFPVALKVLC